MFICEIIDTIKESKIAVLFQSEIKKNWEVDYLYYMGGYYLKNKYKIASVLLFCFSLIMIGIMVVHSVIDYQNYLQHPEYSAPFSANLIFKGVTYGIPIIVGLVLSVIFKRKANKQ